MYNAIQKTIDLGDGRVIEIETGKLAKQADGSVVVKMGNTMLLATVTAAKDAKESYEKQQMLTDAFEQKMRIPRFRDGEPILGMEKFIKADQKILMRLFDEKDKSTACRPRRWRRP